MFCVSAANFTLAEEVVAGGSKRLFFEPENSESSVLTGTLTFPGPAVRTCNTYTAYIRVWRQCVGLEYRSMTTCLKLSLSLPFQNDSFNTIQALRFTGTLQQFDRPSSPVSIDHVPTNFATVPVIEADAVTAEVSPWGAGGGGVGDGGILLCLLIMSCLSSGAIPGAVWI